MTTSTPLTHLSEAQRNQALQRFRVIEPHLNKHISLSTIAKQQNLTLRTLQRWVKTYREVGLSGLVRKPRHDKGQRRVNHTLQTQIEGLALQSPPPSYRSIERQIVRLTASEGGKPPSYWTIRNIVRALERPCVVLAQQGSKTYKDTYDLLIRRKSTHPNAIWQADHCLLKIFLLNEDGKAARPWLTIIFDDMSRSITGYTLTFDAPNILQTALALRQAIWRKDEPRWEMCGIPDVLYVDHGSDFISKHLEYVAADLHIQLVFSIPGMPRGRGKIERFFRTLQQLFLCELPGYTPTGEFASTPTLTLSAFDHLLRTFILETYHERVSEGTRQSPRAAWNADGFVPRMPESLEHLDLLLLTVARTRRVRQEGIRFKNFWYMDTTLSAYVGESVIIRYDPRDLAEIRVYHRDSFICRAICFELSGTTISLKDLTSARNRERHRHYTTIKARRKAVTTQEIAFASPEPVLPNTPSHKSVVKPSGLKRYAYD